MRFSLLVYQPATRRNRSAEACVACPSVYDLKLRMERRVGNFWSARHSQIYPELARLEEGGYVTHQVVEQKDRPNKKVYQLTDTGFEVQR